MKKQGYVFVISQDKSWFYASKYKPTKYERGNHTIDYYLDKFNIDLNDYWTMKKSGNFRFINKEEINKWSGIICFRKDYFNKEHIDKWLDFLYKQINISIPYLNRPFPPIEIFNKIKIIGWVLD